MWINHRADKWLRDISSKLVIPRLYYIVSCIFNLKQDKVLEMEEGNYIEWVGCMMAVAVHEAPSRSSQTPTATGVPIGTYRETFAVACTSEL
jgi:hypothetical protein